MFKKFPIRPNRIRSVPEQFSWVDHRLVRDRYIERLSHKAAALYLFLVTVADCQGLSYYSTPSLCERLAMDEQMLDAARTDLLRTGLIAYKQPLYQLLPLGDLPVMKNSGTPGEPMAICEMPQEYAGGVR